MQELHEAAQEVQLLAHKTMTLAEFLENTVTVYRSESDIEMLTREDTLTGEDVVPGFSCPVVDLFA